LGAGGGTGDEPGVDVKSRRDEEAWGHLTGETKVTVSIESPEVELSRLRRRGYPIEEGKSRAEIRCSITLPIRKVTTYGLNSKATG